MALHSIKPSFNAGELSPRLDVRSDIEKYDSGCQILENFLIMPQGGVQRRGGLEWMGSTKYDDRRSRVMGFNFSTTTRFVLEFGHLYIRFWSNDLQVETSPGAPLEVVTPYLEEHLQDLQYVQINDVMYLVHPSYAPRKLTRQSDTNWTLEELDYDWPPMLDENTEDTMITPSGTTGSITLTASQSIFTADHVGAYFQIAYRRPAAYMRDGIGPNHTTDELYVIGKWNFTTYGTWSATLTIQRSEDGGSTWEAVRTFSRNSDGNVTADGNEEKESLLRVVVTDYVSPSTSDYMLLEATDPKVYGVVKITAVSSGTSATATVVNDLGGTSATKYWSEGAWSAKQGFPRTVAFFRNRLYYGGTNGRPQSIHTSKDDDFENFFRNALDNSAMFFTLAAQDSNPINWMVPQNKLLLGTAGGEWTIEGDSDGVITPTTVRASQNSNYGSKYLRALIANDTILFVQRQGRKVRELTFSLEYDKLLASDLTLLAEHITEGDILELAFQQQPDPILWIVTGAGELIGMTYERQQNVIGWHRHKTDGFIESVATIYGNGTDDEVWITLRRTIDGEIVRYVERIRKDFRKVAEDQDKANYWYLDSAKRFTFDPPQADISGLDHLEGKTVHVLADGAAAGSFTVSGGAITLNNPAAKVLVGLPFVSMLKAMKLEVQSGNGSSRGRKKRVAKVRASIHKSLSGQVSTKAGDWPWINSRGFSDPMNASAPVFSGDHEITLAGGYADHAEISIRQTLPFPLTVLALTPIWEVSGD